MRFPFFLMSGIAVVSDYETIFRVNAILRTREPIIIGQDSVSFVKGEVGVSIGPRHRGIISGQICGGGSRRPGHAGGHIGS